MSKSDNKVKSFTDLRAWKEAHKLALEVYEATNSFPESQRFGLANQLQRAAVSIPSNIAEGFGRQTPKDQIHFLYVALGSVNELQCQLLISKDLKYIGNSTFQDMAMRTIAVSKMVNGLIKNLKKR